MNSQFAILIVVAVGLGLAIVLLPALTAPAESSELKLIQKPGETESQLALQQSPVLSPQELARQAAPREASAPAEQGNVSSEPAQSGSPGLPKEEAVTPFEAPSIPSNEAKPPTSSRAGEASQQAAVAPSPLQEKKATSQTTTASPAFPGLQNLLVIVAVGLVLASAAFYVTKRRSEV